MGWVPFTGLESVVIWEWLVFFSTFGPPKICGNVVLFEHLDPPRQIKQQHKRNMLWLSVWVSFKTNQKEIPTPKQDTPKHCLILSLSRLNPHVRSFVQRS